MHARTVAMMFRTAYLATLVGCAILGMWPALLANLPAFLITLPLFLHGQKDARYYYLDIGIMAIFLINTSLFFTDYWLQPNHPLGFDKVLHFLAGAWLGATALVILSRWIKNQWVLALSCLAFVGAIAGYWELFEWFGSIAPQAIYLPSTGYADSMLDIIAVTLGGIIPVAAWLLRTKK